MTTDDLRRWHAMVEQVRRHLGHVSTALTFHGLGGVEVPRELDDLEREIFEAYLDACRKEVA